VSLGVLEPSDLSVQVVYGRVDADDRLVGAETADMEAVEQYDGGRWLFRRELEMDRNGPFGYTVRVLPRHRGLASPQELGLQSVPVLADGLSA
jgi:starch phosphorylase